MENLDATQNAESKSTKKNSGPIIIGIVTVVILIVAILQFSMTEEDTPVVEIEEVIVEPANPDVEPEVVTEDIVEIPIIEPQMEPVQEITISDDFSEESQEPAALVLPNIDESDDYIKGKLPELTWRNELLSLVITDDIIRRFVVFTDNFAQGLLAYEHSPFVKPKSKFMVDEELQTVSGQENVWQWDSKTSKRFDLYVDLLRSIDSAVLVDFYIESKPLIDEAYSELGYEEDFTYTLQDAIIRVLDMDLPESAMNITRSSVMYKYQDPKLESLDDTDKLLLRIGKENLLIIKSVLLEVNEKLEARTNTAE